MLEVAAHAKLNLFLSVTGKRPDGYHDIDSVMQEISLADRVTLTPAPAGITLTCSDPALPTDRGNLAYRAAEAFFAVTGKPAGVQIHLEKHIPQEAGLAGGSADAAAVLSGCNTLFSGGLSPAELAAIGGKLGADIPFCLAGGTARTRGIGDDITPCAPLPPCTILVAIGKVGVSTKTAYALVDEHPAPPRTADAMTAALACGDFTAITRAAYNVFSAVAPNCVEPLRAKMESLGAAPAMMSGTGSSVFGCFTDADAAEAARAALDADGYRTYLCAPVTR